MTRSSFVVITTAVLLSLLCFSCQQKALVYRDQVLLSMDFNDGEGRAFSNAGQEHLTYGPGLDGRALDMKASFLIPPLASADTSWFSKNSSFSMAVWVKSAQATEDPTLILSNADFSKQPNGIYGDRRIGHGFTLYSHHGAWGWNIGNGAVHYLYEPLAEDQPIADHRWHLLAFTYHAPSREVRLYYDGINKAVLRVGDMDEHDFISPWPLSLGPGSQNAETCRPYQGWLDDFHVWRTTLPADAIRTLYERHFKIGREPQMEGDELTVLNWNIWHGGTHFTLEKDGFDGIDRVAELIRQSGADIVLMQETYGAGSRISSQLGFYYYEAASNIGAVWGANLSVMSRFPLEEAFMVEERSNYGNNYAFNNGGVTIRLSEGRRVAAFSNWYNGRKPEDLEGALTAWQSLIDNADHIPVIWSGDFNSVSHLDDGKGESGHSRLMQQAGFMDAYREAHPDTEQFKGFSNPGYSSRIDFVYFKGSKLTLLKADPLIPNFEGRAAKTPGYPSDHLGIVVKFRIK